MSRRGKRRFTASERARGIRLTSHLRKQRGIKSLSLTCIDYIFRFLSVSA